MKGVAIVGGVQRAVRLRQQSVNVGRENLVQRGLNCRPSRRPRDGFNGIQSGTNTILSANKEIKRMAPGKAIGEFSLKIVTMTITSGTAGSVLTR